MSRRITILLPAAVTLSVAGCYQKEVNGRASIYGFDTFTIIIAVMLVAGALAYSLARFRKGHRLDLIIGVGALAMGIFILPGVTQDYVKVDDDHFECRYGLWWEPSRFNIAFDELQSLQVRSEKRRRGRGLYLDCRMKRGPTQSISLGDLTRRAFPEIVERARAKGIPVYGEDLVRK